MFVQQISEKGAQGFRRPAFRLCDSLRSGILTLERVWTHPISTTFAPLRRGVSFLQNDAIAERWQSSHLCNRPRPGSAKQISIGRVAEWFKAAVLKTARGASPSWVRIPPLPPA